MHSDGYPTASDHPLSSSQFSHADNNFQAFDANATSILPVDVDAVEPDDFYRNYRGIDTSFTAPSGHDELMASAIPTPRQTHNASLRSNGNGTTPRHPPLPTGHNGLRSGCRSASNPVDDGVPSNGARPPTAVSNGKQSVRDLTKRFDQSPSQLPTAALQSFTQLLLKTQRKQPAAYPARPQKPLKLSRMNCKRLTWHCRRCFL